VSLFRGDQRNQGESGGGGCSHRVGGHPDCDCGFARGHGEGIARASADGAEQLRVPVHDRVDDRRPGGFGAGAGRPY